jgi:6-phosphogluconolactonase (cycloisomerase 2 family)
MYYKRLNLLFALVLQFALALNGTCCIKNKNCSLKTPGTTIATGGISPISLKYSNKGNCLAVANNGSDDVTVFKVNRKTGTLEKVIGPSANGNFPTGVQFPIDLAFSPDGACLAVVSEGSEESEITLYRVDPETCSLTLIKTQRTGGRNATAIDYSPDGLFLAVTNANLGGVKTGDIAIFTTRCHNCRLDKVRGPKPNGNFPTDATGLADLKYTPNGNCLIVLDQGCCAEESQIIVYSVDKQTGIITKVPGPDNKRNYDTGTLGAQFLAIKPDGSCLAATSLSASETSPKSAISVFNINKRKCALSREEGPGINGNFLLDSAAMGIDFSPDGGCLAVAVDGANQEPPTAGHVSTFSISFCCDPNNEKQFDAGTSPVAVDYSPNGKQLAVANSGSNDITVFKTRITDFTPLLITVPHNHEIITHPTPCFEGIGTPDTQIVLQTRGKNLKPITLGSSAIDVEHKWKIKTNQPLVGPVQITVCPKDCLPCSPGVTIFVTPQALTKKICVKKNTAKEIYIIPSSSKLPVTIESVTALNGTVTIVKNGKSVLYKPHKGFCGKDTLTMCLHNSAINCSECFEGTVVVK